jgi:hypothetical protein
MWEKRLQLPKKLRAYANVVRYISNPASEC